MKATFTDAFAKNVTAPGRYTDPATKGLNLNVKSRRKYWVFRYAFTGQRRDLTLGTYPEISLKEASFYILTQFIGTAVGAVFSNLMFNKAAIEQSTYNRSGSYLFLAEVIATAGLIMSILLLRHQNRGSMTAVVVPAWIGAAYIFTSSTSFANPAITVARTLSESFTGISMKSVPMFILGQCIGAALGVLLTALLTAEKKEEDVFA